MDSQEFAITVEGIGKTYCMFERPTDRLRQAFMKKKLYTEFQALYDVSFNVPKGQVVGIVGRNGSGKSTLLQIIAGTLMPTCGTCHVNGKVAAILELGSGFNPEYTGRENVYLCGSIFGISREEMDRRFERIAAFADIGRFIDQPVKTYSSGMFARLAFAVNINVDADILIVDEVLSVGDHFFQAKCMSAMNSMIRNGVTILLVSHSQATVKALCDKAILLNKGTVIMEGNCDAVMDRYMQISLSEESKKQLVKDIAPANNITSQDALAMFQSQLQPPFAKRVTDRFGKHQLELREAALFQFGKETVVLESRQTATISLLVYANETVYDDSEIGVVIRTFEGVELFALNTFFKNFRVPPVNKGELLRIDFEFDVLLGPGKYSAAAGIRTPVQSEYEDKVFHAVIFDVVNVTASPIPLLFDVPYSIKIEGSADNG